MTTEESMEKQKIKALLLKAALYIEAATEIIERDVDDDEDDITDAREFVQELMTTAEQL
jgi:hypothetical protein